MTAVARPITRQQAQHNALNFMQQRGRGVTTASLRHAPLRMAEAHSGEPYYVFNIGDDQGYVIASGDDCVPAILGYADSGAIDINDIPANLQAWLDQYGRQIRYLQEKGATAFRAPMRETYPPAVATMTTSKWGQREPYNMSCPIDPTDGNRCVTGCVATAMAQLLYYHRAHSINKTTSEMPAYRTKSRRINVDAIPAGSFIDWDNMIDNYTEGEPTEEQIQAVASLMKYCGAAIEMDYKSEGSTSNLYVVPKALSGYFNYSLRVETVNRSSFGGDWEGTIYAQLSNSCPVLYAGIDGTAFHAFLLNGYAGIEGAVSHAFLLDGYDGNGFYHINFGWDGREDGFYRLTVADSPDELQPYTGNQQAIFYARPINSSVDDGNIIHFADSAIKDFCLSKWDTNDDGELSLEEAAVPTSFDLGNFLVSFSLRNRITSFDEFQYFNGVKSLGTMTFYYCVNMKSIMLPGSLTEIGAQALCRCSSLTDIIIPNSVKIIGMSAFQGCTSMTDVVIGSGVTSISQEAFAQCPLLTVTSLSATPPQLNAKGFDGSTYETAMLRVPNEAVGAYRSTYPWSQFHSIVGLNSLPGDVNNDGEISVADINSLIDIILNSAGGSIDDPLSDVNGDGEVSVADINALVDMILNM